VGVLGWLQVKECFFVGADVISGEKNAATSSTTGSAYRVVRRGGNNGRQR